MHKKTIILFIILTVLTSTFDICFGKTEFCYNNIEIEDLMGEINSINDKILCVDEVIGKRSVDYWEHVIDDVYIKNDSILLHLDSKDKNILKYEKKWTDIDIGNFEFSEIQVNNFFWKIKVIFPEESDCGNFYSFYEKQNYPVACWEVRYKDGTTVLYDLNKNKIGEGTPAPSESFLMTGPDDGNDVWKYLRHNAKGYFEKWSSSITSIFNPNPKTVLSSNVSNPNVELFYEIAHGSYNYFSASTSGIYRSYSSSKPNVREDMKHRTPIKFAFIGSCGGMDKTGNGSFSYEFRKGQIENTVTVGYTGMGGDDGWPKAKPWQDSMFSYIDNSYTIKDAFDLACAEYPKIADAVKFVGDENLKLVNLPPYKPLNPYPKDNSTSIKTSPTLSVELKNPPDPDGDIVTVTFYDASDNSVIGTDLNIKYDANASVTWSDANKKGSLYQWYAVADDGFNSNRSYTWRFKIDIPPDSPVNPSPADNERYVNVSPLLSVDVSDPDDDNMSVTFFDASDDSEIGFVDNVESGGTASITWDGIDYGTTYSWYAVADDGIFDNQSDVFSFTTNYLPVFSGLFPEDGSDDVSFYLDELSVNISDPDGDSFSWSITIGSNIGSRRVGDDVDGTKFCDLGDLMPDTSYSWVVTAVDSHGAKTESIFSFKTRENMPPSKPVALSPSIDALDVSIVCTLNWSCMDPDGDKGLIYDVYFGKSSNPDRITKEITDTYYSIPYDLEIDTTYYWKIIAEDSFGATSESSVSSFKTSPIPPPPAVGSIEINFPKRLYWAGVKADITNNGVRAASNVNWHVYVTGGTFNKVNISKSGCIHRLNSSEKQEISTYESLDFKRTPFGIGKANVNVITTDKDDVIVGMKSTDVIILFRWILVL